ncbi:MAG: sulfotransferase domain-containing protein [Sphingorhabdus sp.]
MFLASIKKAVRRVRRQNNENFLRHAAGQVDGFLVSYPKSGRTWLRFALSCYFAKKHKLDFEPDLRSTFKVHPNFDRSPERGLNAFVGRSADSSLPLIAVSHRSYDEKLFGRRPVIFLVRDPRDVLVSAYFHETRHKHRFDGSIAEFLENDDYGLPAIIRYLNGWAAGLANHDALIISYEDMSADAAAQIRRILEFMGQPVDEAALDAAIEASRFDRMRRDEQKNGIPGHEYDRDDSESLRVRKGKVGGFDEYLGADDVERLMELCRTGLSPEARALITHTTLKL